MNWLAGPGNNQAQRATAEQAKPQAQKKPGRRFLGRLLLALLLFAVMTLAGLSGALVWVCQSQSGQAWLLKTANAALAGKDGGPGLRLTRLSGSLPFDFVFGLEASDSQGVWLEAPENRLLWNWRSLPWAVRVEKLALTKPRLARLPLLPPDAKTETDAAPMSLGDVQALLGQAAAFLQSPPFWLPELFLSATLEDASLPTALLGQSAAQSAQMHVPGAAEGAAQDESAPVGAVSDADSAASLRGEAGLDFSFQAKKGVQLKARASLAGADGKEARTPGLQFRQAALTATASARADAAASGLAASVQLSAKLDSPTLALADLPPDLLGATASLHLALEATGLGNAETRPQLSLHGPSLNAGRVSLEGQGSWQAGSGWAQGQLDGPLDLRLEAALAPAAPDGNTAEASAPLSWLRAPLKLRLMADGALPRPNLELGLDCAELAAGDHSLRDLALALAGKELALPLGQAFPPTSETAIDLALAASLDGHALNMGGQFFYTGAAEAESSPRALRAGLRNLEIKAVGIAGQGEFSALLPEADKPALNGALSLAVADWAALSALIPGFRLNGSADLELELKASPAEASPAAQETRLVWRVPRLEIRKSSGKEVALVQGLTGEAQLTDLFGQAQLAARLELKEARAAAMRLGAKFSAAGPLAGPLNAKFSSTGDVVSRLDLDWQPGEALLRALEARARLSAELAGAKPALLGLKLERAARFHFGPGGIGVDSLDLALTPSGRLRLRGGVAPDKLDLDLRLTSLALKPWSSLAPALPAGTVELAATLKGSPARPSGRFRLGLSGLKAPGSPLPPLDLGLSGGIEPLGKGSALSARLELPPATLKALGGDAARLTARLPLVFGADGVPSLDKRGQIAAQARWAGALGPLWSLVPTADRRLNGRIRLDAQATGTLARPQLRGNVDVSQGRFEDLLLGVLLTDIALRLELDERSLAPQGGLPGKARISLSASDGRGGKAAISGWAALNGKELDLKASLERLRPLRRRDVQIMLSGKATAKGSATAPDIDGEIIVNQGEILLNNLEMSASIVTLPISAQPTAKGAPDRAGARAGASAAASQPKAAKATGGKLNVRIIVLPRFSVEGRGLTSLWKANLLVTGTLSDPQIIGSVEAVRGNFDFLGKNFALTRGAVTFAGGALADPLLDMQFTNERPDLTAHIVVDGTVRKMKLALTSEPPLPRDDILSRVLFGKSVNELGRLEALQLAGAVAQLAGMGSGGGGVFGAAKKALGVDVLRLGSSGGGQDADSADGANLEMGKYLTDNIYMGVQQGMKPDSTAFIIQLELTPRTSLELRSEQQNTWGGIKWNYKY